MLLSIPWPAAHTPELTTNTAGAYPMSQQLLPLPLPLIRTLAITITLTGASHSRATRNRRVAAQRSGP